MSVLSGYFLSVRKLSVILLNAIPVNVVAPTFPHGFRWERRQRLPVPVRRDLDDEAGADASGRRAVPDDAVQDRDPAWSEEQRAGKNAGQEQERNL